MTAVRCACARLLIVFAMGWMASGGAAAGVVSCSIDQAPSGYENEPCNGVCTESFNTITCDLDQGGTGSTEVWVVTDFEFGGLNRYYSMWGTSSDGVDFCCFDDDTFGYVNAISVYGTDQADTISLRHSPSGSSLVEVGISPLTDSVSGGEDADDIEGSAYMEDNLFGNRGDDTIVGLDQDDYLTGNDGDDNLQGREGADTILGGDDYDILVGGLGDDNLDGEGDTDWLEGGAGADTMFGGNGPDVDALNGGDGSDILSGGGGADVLCGGYSPGGGNDDLNGGNPIEMTDAADILWVPSGSNTPSGSAQSNDSCGHTSYGSTWAGASCNYNITSKPLFCIE